MLSEKQQRSFLTMFPLHNIVQATQSFYLTIILFVQFSVLTIPCTPKVLLYLIIIMSLYRTVGCKSLSYPSELLHVILGHTYRLYPSGIQNKLSISLATSPEPFLNTRSIHVLLYILHGNILTGDTFGFANA